MISGHTIQLRPECLTKMVTVATAAHCTLKEGKIECAAPFGINLLDGTGTGTIWSSRKEQNKTSLKIWANSTLKWLKTMK